MRILKQSTAASVMAFMADSTDHITGKAGLTLTITASKNGGAFGSISPTVNDRGSGWYEIQLTTGHTDTLGDLAIHITSTGADPTDFAVYIVPRHLADLCFPTTSGRSIDVDATGGVEITAGQSVHAATIAAGAITATEAPNLDAAVSTRGTADPGDAMTLTAAYDAAKTAAQAGDAMILTGPGIDAILDDVVEGSLTFRNILRIMLAALAGKVTVVGAVRSFRDQADTKNRITGTEDDEGRRTGVSVDGA